jgi:hypothetical protein
MWLNYPVRITKLRGHPYEDTLPSASKFFVIVEINIANIQKIFLKTKFLMLIKVKNSSSRLLDEISNYTSNLIV